jgi:pimeloyl-ACP methyl ester carboxylesterase
MERTQGIKRVIVSGLCGGAVTGLLAGSRDARVAGLLALGITPVLASRAANPSQYMTLGQLQQMREGYLRKIWKPSAWLRLLTLQSDYRVLWRSLVEPMRRKAAAKQGAAPVVPPDDNASPLFPPAFFNMLQARRPMLLVFGGSDRLHWEFEEKFLARHQQRLAPFASGFEVHVVPQANHVLSFQAWQDEMLDTANRWLHKHFKSALTSSEATVRTELAPREAL